MNESRVEALLRNEKIPGLPEEVRLRTSRRCAPPSPPTPPPYPRPRAGPSSVVASWRDHPAGRRARVGRRWGGDRVPDQRPARGPRDRALLHRRCPTVHQRCAGQLRRQLRTRGRHPGQVRRAGDRAVRVRVGRRTTALARVQAPPATPIPNPSRCPNCRPASCPTASSGCSPATNAPAPNSACPDQRPEPRCGQPHPESWPG